MEVNKRNKGRREEIARLKHKKRCDVLGLDVKSNYQLKSDAKPCSCYICKKQRYKRSKLRLSTDK